MAGATSGTLVGGWVADTLKRHILTFAVVLTTISAALLLLVALAPLPDLAVIVADTVSAADVVAVVKRAGAPLLRDVEVFDVYRDAERLGAGHVSLALRLSFRASDRTLTDEEVAAKRRKIAAALADQVQGRVRDS